MADVARRLSVTDCTTPWLEKTRAKVKPTADRSVRSGSSPLDTRYPPRPYSASRLTWMANLRIGAGLL